MSLHYHVEVWQEEDDTAWFASVPDLPGVMTHSETWEGLPAMVEDAKQSWLIARLKRGWDIPLPSRKTA